MSLLQQQSLVKKNKTICLPPIMISIETTNNKQTYQKLHFPGKIPICKDQQIDYLLINHVPNLEKNVNSLSEQSFPQQ